MDITSNFVGQKWRMVVTFGGWEPFIDKILLENKLSDRQKPEDFENVSAFNDFAFPSTDSGDQFVGLDEIALTK